MDPRTHWYRDDIRASGPQLDIPLWGYGVVVLVVCSVFVFQVGATAWSHALVQIALGLLIGLGCAVGLRIALQKLLAPKAVDAARAKKAFEFVAARYGGFRRIDEASMEVVRKGYQGRLEFVGGMRPATDLAFAIEGAIDGHLVVTPETVAHGVMKQFGARDVEIGDRSFDDTHEIWASEEKVARSILDPTARELIRPLGHHFDFVYRVTPRQMLLRANRFLYDATELDVLLTAGIQLFDRLRLPDRDVVDIVETRQSALESAICEICGTALSIGAVVRCRKCGTAHHRDCWEFNGMCSTFACGEKRWVA